MEYVNIYIRSHAMRRNVQLNTSTYLVSILREIDKYVLAYLSN